MNTNHQSIRDELKMLRDSRREIIERTKRAIKIQTQDIKRIQAQLQSGPKTIPEIADAIHMPSSQVLRYVSGLKKYGILVEGAKEEDYFKYELAK